MQRSSVNKVILVGNLGQDPESRFTPAGTAVTNLSIATNESWKDQNGETQERTEWHRVVMYGRMAETAVEYMKKGQMVYVEGRLNTREWEDKNQVTRKTTEIRCDNFTMLGRRGETSQQENRNSTTDAVDDDLPF
ncbi:MAG: single-stranded DNA-binding protein [Candidatus Marinimicrobia bacterium]|mgnify:CR=1 FL=1|nr:single-stranded DNA-binding protein [Candidatus Neomarinimicrobiota bacterium]|tara:strand:+ start:163 stop:567 length:405 start_codon:yes stop_codon:yes gene_type:complete